MSPDLSSFLTTSCCIDLQCSVLLTEKLNFDGHMYRTRCSFPPVFTKAILIQRNRLTEMSFWSSFLLHGSCCGEIVITEEIFVGGCRSGWGIRTAGSMWAPHARGTVSSSSGVLAPMDFANCFQLSPWDSLHRGCEVQWKPPKFLVLLRAGTDILCFLDEWAVGGSRILVELWESLRIWKQKLLAT